LRNVEFYPLAILFYVNSRLANGKPSGKRRVGLQESLNRSSIAGGYSPRAIFAHQVLLHDYLSFRLKRLTNSTEELGIRYSNIPRNPHSSDVNAIQHVTILCSL
jgi:hypothetical protein